MDKCMEFDVQLVGEEIRLVAAHVNGSPALYRLKMQAAPHAVKLSLVPLAGAMLLLFSGDAGGSRV